jgi:hypothetical protein
MRNPQLKISYLITFSEVLSIIKRKQIGNFNDLEWYDPVYYRKENTNNRSIIRKKFQHCQ